MDARTLDIKTIFGQERRHVVPLFQRPYVWERESQLKPLWEDIRSIAVRQLANKPVRAHFLGAIVLDQVPKPTGQVEVREVIDGQQRLTTVQLLFEAFADFCQEHGKDKHFVMLRKLSRNDNQFSTDPDEQFKVWPTTQDQEIFRTVMQSSSPAALRAALGIKKQDGDTGQPIADAYLYFHKALAGWLKPSSDDFETKLDSLFRTLREYVRFVVIDLDQNDDAQVIFETLNARGTPLRAADLVKNLLLHRARQEEAKLEQLYRQYWRPFDEQEKYWRKKFGRGHAQRARIDTFLHHFLTARLCDEVSAAHLFVTFRDFAQKRSAESLFADVSRYAKVYRSFDELEPTSREGLFVERINAMEHASMYPLLLELLASRAQEPDEVQSILVDIESFLVRRTICQLNTRGYNRLAIELLKTLAASGGSASTRVRALLLSSDTDSGRWPSDEEVRSAWFDLPHYKMLRKKRSRMILEALERTSRTGKTEQISLNERLTIEHLMPQEWTKHWPLPDGEDAEDARSRVIHTFGNLTLLTKKLNPSVSNGPWRKKREQITTHSILRLNNALLSHTDWDERAIRKRGEVLFKLFRETWPRPS